MLMFLLISIYICGMLLCIFTFGLFTREFSSVLITFLAITWPILWVTMLFGVTFGVLIVAGGYTKHKLMLKIKSTDFGL